MRLMATLFPFTFTTWFLVVAQTLAFWQFHIRYILRLRGDVPGIAFVVATYLAIIWLTGVVNGLSSRNQRAQRVANIVLILVYVILLNSHIQLRSGLNFSVIGENTREIFYKESFTVIASTFGLWPCIALGILTLALVFADMRRGIFSKKPRRSSAALIPLLGYAGMLGLDIRSYDEIQQFALTGRDYFFPTWTYPAEWDFARYPYVQDPKPAVPATKEPRPHVFVILVESFKSTVVARKTRGADVTPFFNRLAAESLYVDRFYGHSVQTERGHLAVLCGILPSLRKKVATDFPGLRLNCLPSILKEQGYKTALFTSATNFDFDSAGAFWPKRGIDHMQHMGPEALRDPSVAWGWGVREDLVFDALLQHLDHETEQDDRPTFNVVVTLTNHRPFMGVPKAQWAIHTDPRDYFERYENSIHMTDAFIGDFIQQLKTRPKFANSIVIITGDHGYPTGEHSNDFNEIGFYEENFRTPLLIHWPGKIAPQEIRDRAFAQTDIAPTLLNLLGIQAKNHFVGSDILRPGPQKLIQLIQPYDGVYIGATNGRYKYVRHLQTKREFLFDLLESGDPEEHDLSRDRQLVEVKEILRDASKRIFFNQHLIEQNRIWPGP